MRDAISFNSIPGVALSVPGGRENMLVHVKLGVPSQFSAVDLDEVARVFPYGKLLPIEVTTGGLTFGCGRVVTELGDEDCDQQSVQRLVAGPRREGKCPNGHSVWNLSASLCLSISASRRSESFLGLGFNFLTNFF